MRNFSLEEYIVNHVFICASINSDPVFKLRPNILPAGESIVWAAAKETGKFEDLLRYPAEDGEYEKDEMDKLGL